MFPAEIAVIGLSKQRISNKRMMQEHIPYTSGSGDDDPDMSEVNCIYMAIIFIVSFYGKYS